MRKVLITFELMGSIKANNYQANFFIDFEFVSAALITFEQG